MDRGFIDSILDETPGVSPDFIQEMNDYNDTCPDISSIQMNQNFIQDILETLKTMQENAKTQDKHLLF